MEDPRVGALFLALVTIAFLGMAGVLLPMLQGAPDPTRPRVAEPRLAVIAPLAALVLVLLLGLWVPASLNETLARAAITLGGSRP